MSSRTSTSVSSKEARSNDDVEVVHYATTAMSELSKVMI